MASRDDLLAQGVAFLQHPNVAPLPADQRANFLREKGLTEAEVVEAFRRTNVPYPGPSLATAATGPRTRETPPAPASWLWQVLQTVAAAGVGAGLYHLWRPGPPADPGPAAGAEDEPGTQAAVLQQLDDTMRLVLCSWGGRLCVRFPRVDNAPCAGRFEATSPAPSRMLHG